jgi:hypothetical protein
LQKRDPKANPDRTDTVDRLLEQRAPDFILLIEGGAFLSDIQAVQRHIWGSPLSIFPGTLCPAVRSPSDDIQDGRSNGIQRKKQVLGVLPLLLPSSRYQELWEWTKSFFLLSQVAAMPQVEHSIMGVFLTKNPTFATRTVQIQKLRIRPCITYSFQFVAPQLPARRNSQIRVCYSLRRKSGFIVGRVLQVDMSVLHNPFREMEDCIPVVQHIPMSSAPAIRLGERKITQIDTNLSYLPHLRNELEHLFIWNSAIRKLPVAQVFAARETNGWFLLPQLDRLEEVIHGEHACFE